LEGRIVGKLQIEIIRGVLFFETKAKCLKE